MDSFKSIEDLNVEFEITKQQCHELFNYLGKIRIEIQQNNKEISHKDYENMFCSIVVSARNDYSVAETWLRYLAVLDRYRDIYYYLYNNLGTKHEEFIKKYNIQPSFLNKNSD